MQTVKAAIPARKNGILMRIRRDISINKFNYLLLMPAVLYYIVFHYWPMYGAQIAFRNFSVAKGILGSPWVGLRYFREFFESYYFVRLLSNTLILSVQNIIYGFPAPIILALLLNEVKNERFKKTVQTITYLPHFISLVVICGIILDFTKQGGVINQLIGYFGIAPIQFMLRPSWFRPIYIISGIWQEVGWGSIIYLAAISNISSELYEAARIDGAGRWKETIHITLPGIASTVTILLILRVGRIMSIGYEKVLLLYNESTYSTADIISTYVYRRGIVNAEYSFSAAVGLFNSVINLALLVTVNSISRKLGDNSLW
ncbi:MAG: ABC transporter permease [Christensenellales bacterium]|jgi:putative aldouronate transport system permease protein